MIRAAIDTDAGKDVRFSHLRGSRLRRFEEALTRALALPESEWPVLVRNPRPRATRRQESEMQSIRARRDSIAAKLKLEPSLIAPKATIEGLVLRPEETIARLMPWQRDLLGVT
jgi:ribonuclease D